MILLNDFRRQWQDLRNDAVAAFEETGASGWYVLGPALKEFERKLAEFWGVAHAVGVASGLDAIEICLRALGCEAGDKVLTTAISAFATTLAILRLGAVPVFADTDKAGLIDLDAAEEALRRDRSIGFFVPVHLFGQALDMERLASIAGTLEVAIVEDCAQSIGACWSGRATGTAGRMAATSFYPTKNLGAFGDAGAVLTRERGLAEKAAVLRDYGQSAKYEHSVVGYNSRLDEMQASLLSRAALPRVDSWTARRREVAARYRREIRSESVCLPPFAERSESCWHLFPVLVERGQKAKFMQAMKAESILTGEHYPTAIPDQPAMKASKFEIAGNGIDCARAFCSCEVSLPIHPYLQEDEVSAVIDVVNRFRA